MIHQNLRSVLPVILCLLITEANGQFIENFDNPLPDPEVKTPAGWEYATGDGQATMEFVQSNGYATILASFSILAVGLILFRKRRN